MSLVPYCPNQHTVAPGTAFCTVCGAAVLYYQAAYQGDTNAIDPGPFEASHVQPGGAHAFGAPAPWTPTPPRRGRSPKVLLAAIAGLAVVGIVIAAVTATGGSDGPTRTTVSGELTLTDSATAYSGCEGTGGYDDIEQGATVVLTNQDNKILGSTALSAGEADTADGTCTYTFSIDDVPMNDAQYAVEVTHRGKVINSRADMVDQDWTFSMSLGD